MARAYRKNQSESAFQVCLRFLYLVFGAGALQISLNTKGGINTANSLKNAVDASVTVARVNKSIDISDLAEDDREINFNGKITKRNSLLLKNIESQYEGKLFGGPLTGKSTFGITNTNYYSDINNQSINHAHRQNAANKPYGFYDDWQALPERNFTANNNNFVACSLTKDGNNLEIDIYDIVDGDFRFKHKLSAGIGQLRTFEENLDDTYASSGTEYNPFGESFTELSRYIQNITTNVTGVLFEVLSVDISELGQCAISIKSRTTGEDATSFNHHLLIFNLSSIKTSSSQVSGYNGFDTNYLLKSDYILINTEELTSSFSDMRYSFGRCVKFCDEDLLVDARENSFGYILELRKSENYSRSISLSNPEQNRAVSFGDTNDLTGYISQNNLPLLGSPTLPYFGHKFKIFDDLNNGKILIISAPLYDPYTKNELSFPHETKAIGAVYIFKRSYGASAWSYFGAVYGKGYTSSNVD